MEIRYIKNEEIDRAKWDNCIETAPNGRIYAMSWYLDIAADYWDALIVGDYEIVFPLPYQKKLGCRMLSQPPLSQQLGIFAKETLSEEIITTFLKAIPKKFLFGKLQLNADNKIQSSKEFPVEYRVNIELDLRKSIEEIRKEYIRNNKRNINKANNNNINIKEGTDFDRIIQTYKLNLGDKRFNVHSSLYTMANKIFISLKERKNLTIYDAFIDDDFIAGIILSSFQNRTIALFSGCSEKGYQVAASPFLFDYAIGKASLNKEIFDFEGSNTKSVAFVFHGFGGKTVPYPEITIYNVPKFIAKGIFMLKNLLKKMN